MTYELMFGAAQDRQKTMNKPKSRPKASPVVTSTKRNGYGSFLAGLVLGVLMTLVGLRLWQARYPDGSGFTSTGTPSGTIDTRGGGYTSQPPSAGLNALRVSAPRVSLRNCPGRNCQVLDVLNQGTAVSVIEQGGFIDGEQWVRVSARGREGWVSRQYLE